MKQQHENTRPHVVFIFADEWRAQATGYNGDVNCLTPRLDVLAAQSVNVSHAVSGHPVCCPYRGSLMTGQYPLRHGVFINDVELDPDCHSIARAFANGGYRTAYIGKWHLYGSPDGKNGRRRTPVPRSHQLGFDSWWGFECCHNYWESPYYHNDDPREYRWEGYDLFDQSRHAAAYIEEHADRDQPFMMMLSWGPPHAPLQTAPQEYRDLYTDREIELRPNVPARRRKRAVEDLRGYYAHIAALDTGLETVLNAIDRAGIRDNTILVVTGDHGEMAQSQGLNTKFVPFDESVCVPFLIRWPDVLGTRPRQCPIPLDAPDVMPTLLGLCGLDVPVSVQGHDWSPWLRGESAVTGDESAFMQVPAAYHELCCFGLEPYRGVRTRDYTYAQHRSGPWLLFDNRNDPYQMRNLIDDPGSRDLLVKMQHLLCNWLARMGDQFLSGPTYLERAGLSHYREARSPLRERWQYVWERPGRGP